MRFSSETKIFLGILVATVAIIGLGMAFFSKPEKAFTKEEMIPTDAIAVGPKDAKVYLVEFSDFQCPACKAFKPYVDEIKTTYYNKLYFSYRHFPLGKHAYAYKAALATEAAGEQGKFWEMYDLLFSNQEKLSDQKILEGAKLLGLDLGKYDIAVKSQIFKNKIDKDLADGTKFGVQGTPTFFLNGKKLDLASFADLQKAVADAVAK